MNYLATIVIPPRRHLADTSEPFPMSLLAGEFDFAAIPDWDGRGACALADETVSEAAILLADARAGKPTEMSPRAIA